jgi:hypothetical protein
MRLFARFSLVIAALAAAAPVPPAQGQARSGERGRGLFDFERVGAAADTTAPAPDDTMAVTAAIPYLGGYGTGEAYVYLSDAHSVLTNPVVVVEGFDINNDMNWDELYQFLDQEDLIETLRAVGFDAVVLNFTESTDYLQRNAFVVVELLQQVQAAIDPGMDFVLAGASMGGLVARYALAYMESHALSHRVRTFISFDAPHNGANIPLGVQYWLVFFADRSTEAAYNLERLDTPAARQMLVYHHTDPPGATGESDPLRAEFLADLASVGGWPSQPRLVAVANGSGFGADQGYAAGAQAIRYEYNVLIAEIRGNVWAVPDGGSAMIFDGYIRIILQGTETMQVTVSDTRPYDNAPGGFRNTFADLDSTEAEYGDIEALHPSHCFVPTVSALSLDTPELFHDVAGDVDLMSHTPFDVVYYPAANQEHGTITAESKAWFLAEVERGATAVPPVEPAGAGVVLHQNVPNPFNPSTSIRFTLPRAGDVTVAVYDAAGRRVVTLFAGRARAGTTQLSWDGTDGGGRRVSSGVYFYRLETGSRVLTKKMTVLK